MKKIFSIIIVFLVFLISVQLSAQEDLNKIKQKIMKMNEAYSKAELAGDEETILSYYADDAISLPSYSQMLVGREAIKKSMMESKGSFKMTEFKLITLEVFGSGNLFYEIGRYRMAMTVPGVEKPVNDEGKYLTIYQQQTDGSLKIKADTWNTDTNPWEMIEKIKEEKK